MKIGMPIVATLLALATAAYAESVHQTANGDKAYTGEGAMAVEKKVVEVKDEPKAESGKLARVKGSCPQWGYVTYWFGIPAPAGKSVIRLRVYVDGQDAAKFSAYLASPEGQVPAGAIQLPEGAKTDSFVNIDIPVDAKKEWGGLAIKKAEQSDKPGPWIDNVSVLLP